MQLHQENFIIAFLLIVIVVLLITLRKSNNVIKYLLIKNKKDNDNYEKMLKIQKEKFMDIVDNKLYAFEELINESKDSNSLLGLGKFNEVLSFPCEIKTNLHFNQDNPFDLSNNTLSFESINVRVKEHIKIKELPRLYNDAKKDSLKNEIIKSYIYLAVTDFLFENNMIRFQVEDGRGYNKVIKVGFNFLQKI